VTFIPLSAPASRHSPQLVVTLGPASETLAAALAESGATSFRLNASHLGPPQLEAALARIRRACPGAPVVVDLQGAKMRVECQAPIDVAEGDRLTLTESEGGDVVVPHPEFFRQVAEGETLSLDDGKLRLVVERVARGAASVRALNGGRLLHRKGINVEQHPVRLEGLTARDLEACRVAAAGGVTTIAYSFMSDGREAGWVREAAPGCIVLGKIERREATGRLQAIAASVDALWVCRGDLGAQLGLAGLARFVAAVEPRAFSVPVLMAGQVLEHLTGQPEPTRSEVCHLHDLLARGYAGIVLSDETAVGTDPLHATSVAAALLASFRS